ncbi:hypothetical protein OAF37_02185 [Rubripirellula sp.]|nr:acyl-CoA reductase [Rubripirellula sp.]MDB4644844.1 hypothetical protein [Rubripirellula sp.]
MHNKWPNVQFLTIGKRCVEEFPTLPALEPFNDKAIRFLAALSRHLRELPASREYPDIAAFAYQIRKAELQRLKIRYRNQLDTRLGRGVSFHIAPSNVPINFAYSLAAGLISGTSSIVRVSTKEFPQVDILCGALNSLLREAKHEEIASTIAIVRYGRSHEINSRFSALCDVRVIWGGDNSIAEIRRAPLPAKAFDIVFSDRHSASVIDAAAYLESTSKEKIASAFYNDTYLFDQGACSSPRLIYWIGTHLEITNAQKLFWTHLHSKLDANNYSNAAVTSVEKHATACAAAIQLEDTKTSIVRDNRLIRIKLKNLESSLSNFNCNGGIFFEFSATNLKHLPCAIDRKFQTLTYFGTEVESLKKMVLSQGLSGVDRIVPVGNASKFSFIWDGYDLIRQMSRIITTQ